MYINIQEKKFLSIARSMAEAPITKDRLTREEHRNLFNVSFT